MKRTHESTPKIERKTVEKNRRTYMRNLCNEIASLIAPQYHSRVALSQPDRLAQAADYIKITEERISKLNKRKRDLAMGSERINRGVSGPMMIDSILPIVEVSNSDSTLNVVLVSGLNKNVLLSDVITVLEEEGTEVVSVNQYFEADKCLYTLHSQAKSYRVGYEIEMIHKRRKELVH